MLLSHLMGPLQRSLLTDCRPGPLSAADTALWCVCSGSSGHCLRAPSAGQSCSKPVFRRDRDWFGPETPSWFSQGPNCPLDCDVRRQRGLSFPGRGDGVGGQCLESTLPRGESEGWRPVARLMLYILLYYLIEFFKKYKRRKK